MDSNINLYTEKYWLQAGLVFRVYSQHFASFMHSQIFAVLSRERVIYYSHQDSTLLKLRLKISFKKNSSIDQIYKSKNDISNNR